MRSTCCDWVRELVAEGRIALPHGAGQVAFGVVEVDQPLVENAASLALDRGLRSLDSLHLAAALVLPGEGLVFATWDRRLHGAAAAEGLEVLPEALT